MYDEEFRKLKQTDVDLEWHETHRGALDNILDGVMGARDFPTAGNSKDSNGTKRKNKLLANGTCYHLNRVNCKKDICKWKHICNAFMGDHRVADCKKKDK